MTLCTIVSVVNSIPATHCWTNLGSMMSIQHLNQQIGEEEKCVHLKLLRFILGEIWWGPFQRARQLHATIKSY